MSNIKFSSCPFSAKHCEWCGELYCSDREYETPTVTTRTYNTISMEQKELTSEIHNNDSYPEELKPCPFCGKKPLWYFSGHNELFKRKTIHIKCSCGVHIEQSAFRYDLDWLKKVMIKKWNNRL